MASVYLRYNDIWYASYKLADGTWKTPETTKIRNSVYGSRKAKKLALLKANEWEQRELDIRHGRIDLPSIDFVLLAAALLDPSTHWVVRY